MLDEAGDVPTGAEPSDADQGRKDDASAHQPEAEAPGQPGAQAQKGQVSIEAFQEQLRQQAQSILALETPQQQKEALMALEPPPLRWFVLQSMGPDKLEELQTLFTEDERKQILQQAAAQQRLEEATADDGKSIP